MSVLLQDVVFSYHKSTPLLSIPSWSLVAGERVFLHGPSGSGKSTLLNLLAGIFPAQSGEISVAGKRTDAMSQRQRDHHRANHIGYIFQQFNLVPYLSGLDNVLLAGEFSQPQKPLRDRKALALELLGTLGLRPEVWQRPGRDLSIGQQQRVAIARALLNRPDLIIADEPTSALDEENRNSFIKTLFDVCDAYHPTLIFVSHDHRLAEYFNRSDSLSELNKV